MSSTLAVEVDSLPLYVLSNTNVGLNTQRFFLEALILNEQGRLEFNFLGKENIISTEIYGLKFHKLTSENAIWTFGNDYLPSDIFFFHSALEAISFTEVKAKNFNLKNCLFIALGNAPKKEQIDFILKEYGNGGAKFHAVFDNNLIGTLYAFKVSIWLNGKDCKIYFAGADVEVMTTSLNILPRIIKIPTEKISFSGLCRVFSKRPNLKVHKPKGGAQSFLEMLKSKPLINIS